MHKFAIALLLFSTTALFAGDWPAWRGPTGQGTSEEKNLPLKWSAKDNVKWKVPLANQGNSTPVIWGEKLTLTQPQFARLLSTSVRTLVTLESGKIPTETLARRLTELERLTNSLSEVIRKDSLGQWLQTPNRSYNGSKPIEVIERGESDKLWEMIFLLRSGVPF